MPKIIIIINIIHTSQENFVLRTIDVELMFYILYIFLLYSHFIS